MVRSARWIVFACAIALVGCATCAPLRARVDAVPPARTTHADPALIEGATFVLNAGRHYIHADAVEKVRAHRVEAPEREWPVLDELVMLFGMREASDVDCLRLTNAWAARHPNDYAIQRVHLALLESAGSPADLATFAASVTNRFPHEPLAYMVLADACEHEATLPEDEEAHAHTCLTIYRSCVDKTPSDVCKKKATELRALIERPQCHTADVDPSVHIRHGSDAPFRDSIMVDANGRTVFMDPADAFDVSDFVRVVQGAHGAIIALTPRARSRPFRARSVAVLMRGQTVLDSVRDVGPPRVQGTFEFSETGLERLCAKVVALPP